MICLNARTCIRHAGNSGNTGMLPCRPGMEAVGEAVRLGVALRLAIRECVIDKSCRANGLAPWSARPLPAGSPPSPVDQVEFCS